MNGYVAWKKLYDRYNPKTPASLTAAWREVIRPKKLKDMREAGKAIDAWESKVVLLKKARRRTDRWAQGVVVA